MTNQAFKESIFFGRDMLIATCHKKQEAIGPVDVFNGPMVQHSLVAMLELTNTDQLSLERIADVMCHNPEDLYEIKGRGYVKEGYFGDLVLVNMNERWLVQKCNILSKCGWSPFEGRAFSSKVKFTVVNGHICYRDDEIVGKPRGVRLEHYV